MAKKREIVTKRVIFDQDSARKKLSAIRRDADGSKTFHVIAFDPGFEESDCRHNLDNILCLLGQSSLEFFPSRPGSTNKNLIGKRADEL